mmetsp:Transcript_12737/g.16500  ORF Transcript_12737/g.16500 Transcript_12737/m.16500 type:complete len:157 (-) Transcript_12737:1022-1492(-)
MASRVLGNVVLYHYPLTRSTRVAWILHELGIPFDKVKTNPMTGETRTKDFLEKNPNHAVPVLEFEHQGKKHTMIESGAMVCFLADLPDIDVRLAPDAKQIVQRAEYLQMIFHACSWQDMILWNIRMHSTLLPTEMRDESTVMFNKQKWKVCKICFK